MADKINNINYPEMINHYKNILKAIFVKCDEIEPCYWDEEKGNMKYGEEYINAYGYLQKADWRISDIITMKDYYSKDNFHCFGLELLQEVRDRIESYLNNTQQKHEKIVYTYNKYDNIVNDLFENKYHNRNDFHDSWKHYHKLKYFISHKESILSELDFIKSNIFSLNHTLKDGRWCHGLIEDDILKLEKLTDEMIVKVKNCNYKLEQ